MFRCTLVSIRSFCLFHKYTYMMPHDLPLFTTPTTQISENIQTRIETIYYICILRDVGCRIVK